MFKVLKEIYVEEGKIVLKHRAHGEFCFRYTSLLFAIIAILYLLDPYDIIPEAILTPAPFAYVDDVIVIAIAGYFIYKDFEEVLSQHVDKEISDKRIPAKKNIPGEDGVPMEVGTGKDVGDNQPSATRDDFHFESPESIGVDTDDNHVSSNSDVPGQVYTGIAQHDPNFDNIFSGAKDDGDAEAVRKYLHPDTNANTGSTGYPGSYSRNPQPEPYTADTDTDSEHCFGIGSDDR